MYIGLQNSSNLFAHNSVLVKKIIECLLVKKKIECLLVKKIIEC